MLPETFHCQYQLRSRKHKYQNLQDVRNFQEDPKDNIGTYFKSITSFLVGIEGDILWENRALYDSLWEVIQKSKIWWRSFGVPLPLHFLFSSFLWVQNSEIWKALYAYIIFCISFNKYKIKILVIRKHCQFNWLIKKLYMNHRCILKLITSQIWWNTILLYRKRLKGLGGRGMTVQKAKVPISDYTSSTLLFFWAQVALSLWPFPGTLLLMLKWSIHFINFQHFQHINLSVQVKDWTFGHKQLRWMFFSMMAYA